MKSTINRLGKELLLVGIGQAVAAVGSVVGVRLMTGALTPAVYGEVALAITFVTLIQQLLIGPLAQALTRYYNFAHEKGELSRFLGSSVWLAVGISLATLLISAAVGVYLWLTTRSTYLGLVFFTLTFALLSGYNILLDSIQTAARQRAVVAWHQGIGQWLRYLAAVALVVLLGNHPATALAGYTLSALLVLVSQTYFFRRKIAAGVMEDMSLRTASVTLAPHCVRCSAGEQSQREEGEIASSQGLLAMTFVRSDAEWTARLVRYALPFASWGLFTWMQLTSDRWALQTFSGPQAVGLYTVLYQLGYYPLMMATTVFTQFAEPVLFRQAGDGSEAARVDRAQKNTWRLFFGVAGMTVLAVAAAALLHGFVFTLFAAPGYRSVSAWLPVMVLSGGMFACGQIASTTQLNRGAPQALLGPKIVMGVVGALFNLAGAYWLGLPGVVLAGAAFSALYLIWVLLLSRKVHK